MKKFLCIAGGILYFPIYLSGVLIIKAGRIILSLGYFFISDFKKSVDIIKSLFDGRD